MLRKSFFRLWISDTYVVRTLVIEGPTSILRFLINESRPMNCVLADTDPMLQSVSNTNDGPSVAPVSDNAYRKQGRSSLFSKLI